MEVMEAEMRRTANVETALADDPDWKCETHSVCVAAWRQAWWDKIGRKVLHPDQPIKPNAILAEAKKLAPKNMNEKCLQDVLRQMETTVEFVDKRVIRGVAKAIVTYYKTL
jgi:hypothetical protein